MAKMFSCQKWIQLKPQRLPLPWLRKNHPDRYWYSEYNCCPAALIWLQRDCCTESMEKSCCTLCLSDAFCSRWFCCESSDPLCQSWSASESQSSNTQEGHKAHVVPPCSCLDSEQDRPAYRTKIPPKVRETLFQECHHLSAAVPTQVSDCRKEEVHNSH